MITFQLNNRAVAFDLDPDTPLLWVVRDHFKLKGSKKLPSKHKKQQKLIKELEGLSPEDLKNHPAGFSYNIYQKVIAKLEAEGVEDFRIDFEDGFGNSIF